MKLLMSPGSPYARKARIVAHELGLTDRIECVAVTVGYPENEVTDLNPLGKIPALIQDDGTVLYDSPVICEFLNSLGGGVLFHPSGAARWTAVRRQALSDGILDAAVLCRYEGMRPEGERSPTWVKRQQAAIVRGLDAMEKEAGGLSGPVTIGHIAFACALGYLDFRFPDLAWRKGRPTLNAWYSAFELRPSMVATDPAKAS